MIDYREILRLDSLGYSRRRISSMVNSSHHTVEDTLKAAHDTGITWPLEDDVTNAELQGILFPWKYVSDSVYAMPDFAYIHRELAKNGVTLTLLWEEYCTKVRSNGSVPYCKEHGAKEQVNSQSKFHSGIYFGNLLSRDNS